MTLFQTIASFLALMALVGWANAKTVRLPQSVALLLAGVLGAGALLLAQTMIEPFWGFNSVRAEIARMNFSETVLDYILAFLLFSSGMQLDLGEFRRRRLSIWSLATIGVLVSALLVGLGIWRIAAVTGVNLSLAWALVFGCLISPTDPVAVMANVRSGSVPQALGAILQGEALFNDGVGLVAFTAALEFARSGVAPDLRQAAVHVVVEVGGGLVLGGIGGWAVTLLLRSIDDYVVELIVSLALATGVFSLAQLAHVSGPIAAGAAGLVIGSYGVNTAMSEQTRGYITGFWHLLDEVLNGLLFLLMGLQIFVIAFNLREIGLWVAAIILTVLCRFVVVLPWGAYFHFTQQRGSGLLLAWGGLRGAVSLALAFSLPSGQPKDILVATTFAVVIFSSLVQGMTFGGLSRLLTRGARAPS